MKIYPGPGLVADKSGAMVLPVRIDGAQYTPFSRHARPRPAALVPADHADDPAAAAARDSARDPRPRAPPRRRQAAGRSDDGDDVRDVELPAHACSARCSTRAACTAGGTSSSRTSSACRSPTTSCIVRALLLGGLIASETRRGEAVGVMLPNAIGAVATLFGLQARGRVAAMLNYTLGAKSLLAAVPGRADPPHLHVGAVRRRSEARAPRRPACARSRPSSISRTCASASRRGSRSRPPSRAASPRCATRACASCPTRRRSCCSRRARKACRKASRCRTRTCSPIASRSRRASISARRT